MGFTFKKAERSGTHAIVGFMGGTGAGKTFSALEFATGLSGGKPFAFIDTEAGRALHYADDFNFQHGELAPPFRPGAYLEAILAAEKAGFPVIVVDSMTHEHAGEGGILDMHDEEYKRLGSRDAVKMLAWVKPKKEHKRMVSKLLQLRAHLVLCFRAEPKLKMVKAIENGREVSKPVDAGWLPICAKGLEFEMTASFMLSHEKPGTIEPRSIEETGAGYAIKVPKPLLSIFEGSYRLNRIHGQRVAEWAEGGKKEPEMLQNGALEKLADHLENLQRKSPPASLPETIEDCFVAADIKGRSTEDGKVLWRWISKASKAAIAEVEEQELTK